MVKRHKTKGFTLFELIVTIAVAAIIVTVGVPGFTSIVNNNRTVTHTNDLVTALNVARSEATRRGTDIFVCSSTNGTGCAGSADWSTGWIVRTAGGDVLRAWAKRSGGDGVVTAASNAQFWFRARGSLGGGPAEVRVQLPDCTNDQARAVSVNAAGRIATSRVACQ